MIDATSLGQTVGIVLICFIGFLAGYKKGYYLKRILGEKIE